MLIKLSKKTLMIYAFIGSICGFGVEALAMPNTTTDGFLVKQWLGTVMHEEYVNGYNCLMMDVDLVDGDGTVLFFAGEHSLREDLEVGEPVRITWEHNRVRDTWRVLKVEPRDYFIREDGTRKYSRSKK